MGPLAAAPILIDQVYDRLVVEISEGRLRPGQRIRQANLAATLGVSRQPVSHALQLLKRQRLVEEAGRKGLQVAPIDASVIRNLYQLRTALDGLATRLAAERVASGQAEAGARSEARDALARGLALGAERRPRISFASTSISTARSTACRATRRSARWSPRNGRI